MRHAHSTPTAVGGRRVVLALLAACAGCAGSVEPAWRLVTPRACHPRRCSPDPPDCSSVGSVPPDSGPVLVVRDHDSWRGVSVAPTTGYGQVATLDRVAAGPGRPGGGPRHRHRRRAPEPAVDRLARGPVRDRRGAADRRHLRRSRGRRDHRRRVRRRTAASSVPGAWLPGSPASPSGGMPGRPGCESRAPPALVGSPPAVAESATAASAVGRVDGYRRDPDLARRRRCAPAGGAVAFRRPRRDWRRTTWTPPTPEPTPTVPPPTSPVPTRLPGGRPVGDTLAGWWVTGDSVGPLALPHREVDRYPPSPRSRDGQLTAIAVGDGSGLLTREAPGRGPRRRRRPAGAHDRCRPRQVVLLLRRSDGANRSTGRR